MSSLNMCVFALCLVLIAVAESHIIKIKNFKIPPEEMTLVVTMKNKANGVPPIRTMNIAMEKYQRNIILSASDSKKVLKKLKPGPDFVPILESRNGIRVGSCPIGFVMQGGFCFPDDDY